MSTYRIAEALGTGWNIYDPEGRQIGWTEDPGEAGKIAQAAREKRLTGEALEQFQVVLELASRPKLCLEVGTTDDGERWPCIHPEGHLRYWFDHIALTEDPERPVVMWRRYDGDQARYLQPVERQEQLSDEEWEASARR